ncbi:MAG: PqqD family protein [Bacillota bacterium]|nr:PqqD family protein [Bacillota bacterium]
MTQYIQKAKFEKTELDGEWIILNTEDFTVTKLNEVGGLCWALLNEIQTVETLTQSLLEKFSSQNNMEQVKRDIEEFLSQLVHCGLIQHVD